MTNLKNDYNGTKRCKSESSGQSWCPETLQNPKKIKYISENRNFSSDSGNITQIKPQRYQMKLRPGQPMNFSFSFKGAEDYPVDLYFLFDASLSMTSTKNHAAENSAKIYQTMKNMTNNVFLGMGSFIDKNALPFTLNVTDNLAYSFRHHLKLINDSNEFQRVVNTTPVGQNRDVPEGGLDALAQAITCKKHIGWRNESRKIIIFLTNSKYHAAGDGRSGGIFKPYDGQCYTENGVYTKELEMDYPSVSMINKLAKQNEVIIIFAVTFEFNDIYQSLSNAISGSKMVTIDVKKKDEIVTTLKKIYEDITKKIKLNVDVIRGSRKNIEISFEPDCEKESFNCDVRKGKEQIFNGIIKVLKYDGIDDPAVSVTVEGIHEKLTLEIDVLKDCECTSKVENSSMYCNGEKRECGICVCTEGKYGDNCACDVTSVGTINDDSTCFGEGMSKPCSGSGTCICGACECFDGYKGVFCECNASNCSRDARGILCGGKGDCQCDGTCKCHKDWSGDNCECYKLDERCKTKNNTICNNRGSCDCGSCKCHEKALWDGRQKQDSYCVLSPCLSDTCHELQCKKLIDCVLCRMTDNLNCSCLDFAQYELHDKLPEDIVDWSVCPKLRVGVGCYTNYAYMYDDHEYEIIVKLQKIKDCADIYYWTGGAVLLTVLLVGIFTLLFWKLYTYLRDRNEYLTFVQDHKELISAPCKNPLYEPASTTFNNPAFRKRSINKQ